LLHNKSHRGIARLDWFAANFGYLDIEDAALKLADQLWADARAKGLVTAPPYSLDTDVILAAQAQLLSQAGQNVIVMTDNIRHLGWFVHAQDWRTM
jgi:hypothetical protein